MGENLVAVIASSPASVLPVEILEPKALGTEGVSSSLSETGLAASASDEI